MIAAPAAVPTTAGQALPAADVPGLDDDEARCRLATDGHNELAHRKPRPLWRVGLDVLREPMFRLLLAAGAIYLLLGDRGEALMLLGFACASMAITIVQEARTDRALDALRELSQPRARVIRSGRQRTIASRDVVRGDALLLDEGERVAADGWVREAAGLQIDESLLSGESVPVSKSADPTAAGTPPAPGGDGLAYVYAGTLVVRGQGRVEVAAVGAHGTLGHIGALLQSLPTEDTPLALQLHRIVRWFAVTGLALSAGVVLVEGLVYGEWLQGLLAGIALAMALLPEEFPLVMTVFFALGARRMAQRRVLARRAATIETLGAATVLCTDKTGTLTRNRMAIAELRNGPQVWRASDAAALSPALQPLLRAGLLASDVHPNDPMDRAFHERAAEAGITTDGLRLQRRYGLSPTLLAVTQVWRGPAQAPCPVAIKGAPEAVAGLCGFDAAALAALHADTDAMAAAGLRVLGVAEAAWNAADPLPDSAQAYGFRWLGLVGLADPLRPTVAQAIADCRAAGVRVIMVTGDYPATARAIAEQAGLDGTGSLLTGTQLDALDDTALRERLRSASICARVLPVHKLRIVQALKADGEIVAMTGDGVNDAPSLRAAHIGIAMGRRGTDVAREAAALVLLDDDFGALASALRLGRRIYDNLRKAVGYILAVHVPIAGLSLGPLLLGWPAIIGPVHIVFIELLIDPVCSLVFEAEPDEADVMRRPPRPVGEPLFSRSLISWALLQGLCVAALVLAAHAAARHAGWPVGEARALSFLMLIATNFSLIFINRSFSSSAVEALRRRNPALWVVAGVTALLLAATLYVPLWQRLFGFETLSAAQCALGLGAGGLVLLVLETLKRISRRSA